MKRFGPVAAAIALVLCTGGSVTASAAPGGSTTAEPVRAMSSPGAFRTATEWAWVYSRLPSTKGANQRVVARVLGATDKDKNAALLLRRSASSFVQVNFSGARYQVSLVRGGGRLVVVDRPLAAGVVRGGSATARAEIVGTTVRGYWNGRLVHSARLPATATFAGRGTGLGIWQDVAASVRITSAAVRTLPAAPARRALPPLIRPHAPGDRTSSEATRMYGTPRSGLPWHSGFWTGGFMSAQRMASAESWRGSAMDFATTYPEYGTWADLADSEWHITTFNGFKGRLAYGLPMLPGNRRGQWGDITSGSKDEVFRTIARQLVRNGRGDTAIRVGLEANGEWFPWAVTASTAPQFKASFRRIVNVMRAEAPGLTFWLDLNAGSALKGQTHRLDSLTLLYPGDDVVDGISIDHYDHWNLVAETDAAWKAALRPRTGAGLADTADFARARGKGFAVPEWGLHGVYGTGDNPFFMTKMYGFFQAYKDVLVYENYFNEPDAYIRNAIWGGRQNPRSAEVYRRLW